MTAPQKTSLVNFSPQSETLEFFSLSNTTTPLTPLHYTLNTASPELSSKCLLVVIWGFALQNGSPWHNGDCETNQGVVLSVLHILGTGQEVCMRGL